MDQLALYVDALKCGVAGWWEIWGDPLLSGTIFVSAYAGLAALVLLATREERGRERWLWRLAGLFFVFQAFNTPLDLHALPGTIGRCLAHAQGWYENRAQVQLIFLIALAVTALLALIAAVTIFRRNLLSNFFLILGIAITLGITITKGINYHGTEQMLNGAFGPMRGADVIELGGISVAVAAALKRLHGRMKRPRRP